MLVFRIKSSLTVGFIYFAANIQKSSQLIDSTTQEKRNCCKARKAKVKNAFLIYIEHASIGAKELIKDEFLTQTKSAIHPKTQDKYPICVFQKYNVFQRRDKRTSLQKSQIRQ